MNIRIPKSVWTKFKKLKGIAKHAIATRGNNQTAEQLSEVFGVTASGSLVFTDGHIGVVLQESVEQCDWLPEAGAWFRFDADDIKVESKVVSFPEAAIVEDSTGYAISTPAALEQTLIQLRRGAREEPAARVISVLNRKYLSVLLDQGSLAKVILTHSNPALLGREVTASALDIDLAATHDSQHPEKFALLTPIASEYHERVPVPTRPDQFQTADFLKNLSPKRMAIALLQNSRNQFFRKLAQAIAEVSDRVAAVEIRHISLEENGAIAPTNHFMEVVITFNPGQFFDANSLGKQISTLVAQLSQDEDEAAITSHAQGTEPPRVIAALDRKFVYRTNDPD